MKQVNTSGGNDSDKKPKIINLGVHPITVNPEIFFETL